MTIVPVSPSTPEAQPDSALPPKEPTITAEPEPSPTPVSANQSPTLQRRIDVHKERVHPMILAIEEFVEAEKSIDDLVGERDQLKQDLLDLRESISQIDKERKGLQSSVTSLAEEKNQLRSDICGMKIELNRMRKERDALAAEDEAFAAEHLRHDAELDEKIAKLKELSSQILRKAKPK